MPDHRRARGAAGRAGPLFGLRVLVTRPANPRDELVAALRRAGAAPVSIPMIEIEEVPEGRAAVEAVLRQSEAYAALIFTSRNAVHRFAAGLRASGTEPAALHMPAFCVGPATARLARESGFSDVEVPDVAKDAEALAAAIVHRFELAGRRVLFLRAERARELIPERLREAGAAVDDVVLYRSVPVPVDAQALRAALATGEFDALTFTSPSAVRVFVESLDETSRAALAAVPIAALGPTTARALRAAALSVAAVAVEPTPTALVEALVQHRLRQQ